MGKRKGTWGEHLYEGCQFFMKLNIYNKGSFRNVGYLHNLEKYLWLSWCLHPSWSLSSHLFDHKRETGAELQAEKKKCRAQLCHFHQPVLALFVLWDR